MASLRQMLDNDQEVLAKRKHNFAGVFERETGHKIQEFNGKPKELAELLNENPESKYYFDMMMEFQERVDSLAVQVEKHEHLYRCMTPAQAEQVEKVKESWAESATVYEDIVYKGSKVYMVLENGTAYAIDEIGTGEWVVRGW